MTCSWCEEANELIKLCDIEDHRVCKICYEKYRESYPLRLEGCPYCKGNEETVVVKIHIPEVEIPEVEIPEVEIPEVEIPEVEIPEVEIPEVEIPAVIIPEPRNDVYCDPDIVSMIIIITSMGFVFWVCILSARP
jgi:hypothetical protein